MLNSQKHNSEITKLKTKWQSYELVSLLVKYWVQNKKKEYFDMQEKILYKLPVFYINDITNSTKTIYSVISFPFLQAYLILHFVQK